MWSNRLSVVVSSLAVLLLLAAFSPPATEAFSTSRIQTTPRTTSSFSSSTQLLEGRRWNFNEGRSPWGLKKNAEIWNGRVAQVGFTVVFLQELITGKGVIQGVQEGNIVNLVLLGLTVASVVGLTAFLAAQGDDEYRDSI